MAILLADVVFAPGNIIAWLLVGLISGFLAGSFMKGGGYGLLGDIVVGLVGSLVGGFLMNILGQGDIAGFWGTVLISFVGACVFIAITRALTGRRAV